MHVELLSVDHPSRVHIDIETDDIEAEVGRLLSRVKRSLGSFVSADRAADMLLQQFPHPVEVSWV